MSDAWNNNYEQYQNQNQNPEQRQVQGYEPRQGQVTPRRGDGFDVGQYQGGGGQGQDAILINLLSNPDQLSGLLQLTPEQAQNVRSLIVAGGAGGVHKFLQQYLGSEISGALGGLIGGWIAKKIIK